MVLGLDPALAFGWAVLDDNAQRVASGTWDLSCSRWEGGGMPLLRLRKSLLDVLDTSGIVAVGYEEVRRHMSTDSAHSYGEMCAVVKLVCEGKRVPFRSIPVGTIKRTATGRGNASKDEMIDAAEAAWKYRPADDNEADALWCAMALHADVRLV